MASNQGPPNNPIPLTPASLGEEYRKRSMQLATKFYEADSQLERSERQELSSAFWFQTMVTPFFGLPVIYGAIMAPNWLKKAGYLKPKANYRGTQVVLGLFGVFLGQAVAKGIGFSYYQSKFSSQPKVSQAWAILGRIDPHIGYRYYGLTARRPEMAMKNPSEIDWSKNMAFPLNLVFTQKPLEQAKEGWPSQNPEQGQKQDSLARGDSGRYPQQATFTGSNESLESNGSEDSNTLQGPSGSNASASSEPSHNSWDKVRAGLGQSPQVPTTKQNKDNTSSNWWGKQDSQSEKQEKFDALIDRARGGTWDVNPDDEQKKFDDLINREREGNGLQDDFSESEKKW